MAVEIKMPQLSDTMHSGKILSWNKRVGENVARGEVLAEVETDKANLQIECFNPGVLLKIVVPEGTAANVGEVIAYVGQSGESVADGGSAAAKNGAAAPSAKPESNGHVASAPVAAPAPTPAAVAPQHGSGERIKASPLAKKIAEQRNVDLSTVQGSGPHGRIIRKDVEQAGPAAAKHAVEAPSPIRQAAATPAQPQQSTGAGTLTPLSKMRETIARRMQEAVREAPHFYTTATINMGQALRLRAALKERAEYKGISVNHLVIKAAAYALEREPRINSAMRDGQLFQPADINIGVITAVEDGLLIPVIRAANTLALKDLTFEARAAVERARAGRPSASDLVGGTFSISNMGMFDVDSFTAIINPGQGAILAVGSVRQEPIVEGGSVVAGSVMRVTLSVDHRIIDGVMAGTFLKHFREALELPALLMV